MTRAALLLPISLMLGLSTSARANDCSAWVGRPAWVPNQSCRPTGTDVCQFIGTGTPRALDCGLGRLPAGHGEMTVVESGGRVIAWGSTTTSLGATTSFCCQKLAYDVTNVQMVGTGGDDELAFTYVDSTSVRHDLTGSRTGIALGRDGHDVIEGSYSMAAGYIDDLFGEGHDDTVYGNDGDDQIDGGIGFDHLAGGNGDDSLIGGDHDDVLHGGNGDDSIWGRNGDDEVCAEPSSGAYVSVEYVDAGGNDDVVVQGDWASITGACGSGYDLGPFGDCEGATATTCSWTP